MPTSAAPKIAGTVVISAIILVTAYFILSGNQDSIDTSSQVTVSTAAQVVDDAATPSAETQPAAATETPSADVVVSTYTDGTYNATKSYRVPEGHTEEITVTLTLTGDVISGLAVDTVATNDESQEYQAGFDSSIQDEVSGQDLDDADVSRLSGASLTSSAFNDLLDAIRGEAQA